jgi:glycine cleavage system H protein
VYVELPTVGRVVAQKGMRYTFPFILLMYVETFAAVESVKAASDIYAPISGEVVDINSELESEL